MLNIHTPNDTKTTDLSNLCREHFYIVIREHHDWHTILYQLCPTCCVIEKKVSS
jgi:hypothetical protein